MIFQQSELNIDILDILRFKRNKEYISTSNKPVHTFGFRISGCSNFFFHKSNGEFLEKITVSAGELIYIPPNIDYHQTTEGEEIIAIHVAIQNSTSKDYSKIKFEDLKNIKKLFFSLHECWASRKNGYYYETLSIFYKIFSLIQKQKSETFLNLSKNEQKLLPAVKYIKTNYSNPNISIEQLAELIDVSTEYFRRIFKATYNTTPNKYLNMLRINKAIQLLKYNEYSIQNISLAVGFNDSAYFSRVFSQYVGISPSKYLQNKPSGNYEVKKY